MSNRSRPNIPTSPEARWEDFDWLIQSGESETEALHRTGLTKTALDQRRSRAKKNQT